MSHAILELGVFGVRGLPPNDIGRGSRDSHIPNRDLGAPLAFYLECNLALCREDISLNFLFAACGPASLVESDDCILLERILDVSEGPGPFNVHIRAACDKAVKGKGRAAPLETLTVGEYLDMLMILIGEGNRTHSESSLCVEG